jgi:uncharacterized Zn finger protein (UPF0148 family)
MNETRRRQEENLRRLDPDGTITAGRGRTCPCCGFPLLTRRGAGEICPLCWWEDEGLDDESANEASGANAPYTLAQAREAFRRYGVMYPPEDDPRIGGADTPTETAAKQRIVARLEQIGPETTEAELASIYADVDEALEIIDDQLKAKVARYEAQERRRRDRME